MKISCKSFFKKEIEEDGEEVKDVRKLAERM